MTTETEEDLTIKPERLDALCAFEVDCLFRGWMEEIDDAICRIESKFDDHDFGGVLEAVTDAKQYLERISEITINRKARMEETNSEGGSG